MLGLSYAIRLSPRIEKRLTTLFTPSPSRVGHPGVPYNAQQDARLRMRVGAYAPMLIRMFTVSILQVAAIGLHLQVMITS